MKRASIPYVIDIANPLVRVLDHAATLAPHRVAGYAANAAFWLDEVEHCFAVLDGYSKRFYAMRHATTDYVANHPVDPQRSDSVTATTQNIKDFQVKEARDVVADAARKFFRRCAKLDFLSSELMARADQLLNLQKDDSVSEHETV